ncbi:MAG: hypothetical protein OEW06_17525, partial [Gemmatimonadota bacterium]|nr:hypothetical protein [Gemmatimonadota bacterium]
VFTLLARVPSLLAAAGTVALAAFTAREITGSRVAPWIAGAAVMLLYPMAYYGRTSNVDMGALCWTALTVAVTARILTRGWSLRRAVAVGMAAALATATKDPSYAACLPLGLLLVARQARHPPAGGGWSGIAVAVAAALATYVVASGLVFAPERFRMHLDFILHGSQVVGLDGKPIQSPFYNSNPPTMAGYAAVLGAVARALRDSMSYPLLAMAGIGLVWPRRARWLALPAVGILVGVILPVRFVQLRFVLIIAYALTLLGAIAMAGLLEDRRRPVRVAAVLLLGGLAWNGLRVADLTGQMLTDSRYDLARWLERTARPGDHVGYYGAPRKLPRLSERIVTVPMPGQPGYGRFRPTGVDRPEFILVIPQQTFEGAHEWQLSEAAFEQLVSGSTGYRQVYVAQGRTMFRHRPITFVNPPVRAFAREDVAEVRGLPLRRTPIEPPATGAGPQ